jgi:hypothetical protein
VEARTSTSESERDRRWARARESSFSGGDARVCDGEEAMVCGVSAAARVSSERQHLSEKGESDPIPPDSCITMKRLRQKVMCWWPRFYSNFSLSFCVEVERN